MSVPVAPFGGEILRRITPPIPGNCQESPGNPKNCPASLDPVTGRVFRPRGRRGHFKSLIECHTPPGLLPARSKESKRNLFKKKPIVPKNKLAIWNLSCKLTRMKKPKHRKKRTAAPALLRQEQRRWKRMEREREILMSGLPDWTRKNRRHALSSKKYYSGPEWKRLRREIEKECAVRCLLARDALMAWRIGVMAFMKARREGAKFPHDPTLF